MSLFSFTCHQMSLIFFIWSSVVISWLYLPSSVINFFSCHQFSLIVICCHQSSVFVIFCHQLLMAQRCSFLFQEDSFQVFPHKDPRNRRLAPLVWCTSSWDSTATIEPLQTSTAWTCTPPLLHAKIHPPYSSHLSGWHLKAVAHICSAGTPRAGRLVPLAHPGPMVLVPAAGYI